MADLLIQTQSESTLANSLLNNAKSNKRQTYDHFAYRVEKSYPHLSHRVISVSPDVAPSGDPASSELRFKIPRNGFIADMVIESALTTAGNNTASADDSRLGTRVFSNIQLMSKSNSICTIPQDATDAYLLTNPNVAKAMNDSYISQSGTWSNSAVTVYTPVYLPFFEKKYMWLDAQKVEAMDLVCTVASQTDMGIAAALTAGTFKLYIKYVNLDNATHEALTAKNYPLESPLVMKSWDMYREVPVSVTNGDTSEVINLRCPNLVFRTFIMLKHISSGAVAGLYHPITSVSFEFAGQPLYTQVPSKVMRHLNNHSSNVSTANTTVAADSAVTSYLTDDNIYVIEWGCEPENNSVVSGAIGMRNAPGMTLTAYFADPGNSNYELSVVHQYHRLVSVNAANGAITASLSQ